MDFFSGFGRRVSKTAKIVGEKTRGSVEANRINGEMRAVKAEIEKLYRAYGEICYRERGAVAPSEDRAALEAQITGKFEQLDKLKAQMDALRDIQRCPECGAVNNSKGTRFCGHCGARLREPEPESVPEPEKAPEKLQLAFCTECGEPRKDGVHFCTACGSDFEVMEARASAAEAESGPAVEMTEPAERLSKDAETGEAPLPEETLEAEALQSTRYEGEQRP